jgi:hypothetical protein
MEYGRGPLPLGMHQCGASMIFVIPIGFKYLQKIKIKKLLILGI